MNADVKSEEKYVFPTNDSQEDGKRYCDGCFQKFRRIKAVDFVRVALYIFFLAFDIYLAVFKPLITDGGIYLLASRSLYSGLVPYRDFFLNQGPLLAAIYGLSQFISKGLLSGRLTAVLFSFIALVLAGRIARRTAGASAEILAIALIALNPMLMNFHIKTYPLTSFLLAASLYLLSNPGRFTLPAAGFLASLTILNRITSFPLVMLIFVYILFFTDRSIRKRISAVLTGILPPLLVYGGLFLLGAGENMLYDMIIFQRLRPEHPLFRFSWLNKFQNFQDLIEHMFVFLCAPILFLYLKGAEGLRRLFNENSGRIILLSLLMGYFSIISMFALPFRTYFGYFLDTLPVLAAGSAALLFAALKSMDLKKKNALLIPLILWLVLTPFRLANEFIIQPFQNYQSMQKTTPIQKIRKITDFLKKYIPENGMILTFESSIPVTAGFDVLPGLEGGPDAYVPQWSTELCRKRKLVNDEILADAVDSGKVHAVILSDHDFMILSIHCAGGHGKPLEHPQETANLPLIDKNRLDKNYAYRGSFKNAGQWNDDVHICIRRDML